MLARVADPKDTEKNAQEVAADKLAAAQATFQKAFREFVDAAMDYGWDHGWLSGFDTGWDAAFDHFKLQEAELKATAAKDTRAKAKSSVPQPSLPLLALGKEPDRATAAEAVLEHIERRPGARGVEIARALEPLGIPERTVRTALHRGKLAGKILIIGGGWFTAEHAKKEFLK